jgi:hypothetical protein
MVSLKKFFQGQNMPRLKITLATFALLLSSLACVTILGEDTYTDGDSEFVTDEPQIQDIDPPQQTVFCPRVTDGILEIATSSSESESEALDEEVMLVTYAVNGDGISDPYFEEVAYDLQDEQNDEVAHQQVWDYFATLIPAKSRGVIAEYSVFTDGMDNTLAAVTQTQTDPESWALQVDIADTSEPHNLTFTLIHEFGHLLTLGPDQVPPSLAVFNNPDDDTIYFQEVSACPNYFPGEGCANADSYVDAFYNQFWADLHEEWNEINLEEDDDIYYEKLDEFYLKYQDQFVTDYAATNPEEDMAESWTFFVLSPEPAGDTIAEEKMLFFHQYPELVQLRSDILGNICSNFPQ